MVPGYRLLELGWHDSRQPALRAVRTAVFIDEQRIPADEEFDASDPDSLHVLVLAAKRDPVGTGRLEPAGRLGRIAVVRTHRGCGVGRLIVARLLECARRRALPEVVLASQRHACAFYAQFGFVAEGPEFMDAGIPHIAMRLRLAP